MLGLRNETFAKSGLGSHKKKAEPLTIEEEELLWQKGLLGSHSPQALVDTMVVLNGLYFALRSGSEHHQLRSHPCQIQLIEKHGQRPYLEYTEDVSKNRQGGIKGRKVKPKVVRHHDNPTNPDRCFVRLFKLYQSVLPKNRPNDSFYFHPLKEPTQGCWFTPKPIGHNLLQATVTCLCREAGISGFRTNHSLCATTATRMYQASIDEQLIMERTGHRSLEGVREYKRTSDNQKEQLSDLLNSQPRENVAPSDSRPGQQAGFPPYGLQLAIPPTASGPALPKNSLVAQNSCPLQFNNTLSMFQNIMPPAFNFSSCTVTINNYNHHS